MNKKDKINILILIAIYIVILLIIVKTGYLNGSVVDFDSQHTVFPDYFRKLFYSTHQIFPSFAANIGAGENIYNFSYYGLLNPLIIFSYLLPSINMVDYITYMMIVVILVSIILCYKWLRNRYDSDYSFLGTLLFLLSSPIIYHTHRHIMFIDYMPFLFLALIGVDKYFDNKKSILLTISVFLIIMTSYYYSVVSLICIVIYGIFRYIEINKKITFKSFMKDGFKFLYPIIIGMLLSSVLLLPTINVVLTNRNDITNKISLLTLFIPTIKISEILYSSYTIGLTSILLFSLIYSLQDKNKSFKFIAIIISLFVVFPIFIYLLNGGMYVRGKVLIPLLPICILLVVNTLSKLKSNKKINISLLILSIVEIIINIKNKDYIYIIDVIILFITYILYLKFNKKNIIIYPLIITAFVVCITCNSSERFISKEQYNKQYDNTNYEIINNIEDDNVYRTGSDILGKKQVNYVYNTKFYLSSVYSSLINSLYTDFSNNLMGSEMEEEISISIMPTGNIIYNTYMGLKYLITDKEIIGYENVSNNVYVNNNVLPIGYSTSNIMSKEYYENLSYPDKIYALFSNAIVDDSVESKYESVINKIDLNYEMTSSNLEIKDNEIISDNGSMTLKLDKNYQDSIIFIKFDMGYQESCSIGNTSITINGIKNTLSCKSWTYPNKNFEFTYVLSNVTDQLNIEFSNGKYVIENVEVYEMKYSDILSFVNSVSKFNITYAEGDNINGNIDVLEDGYFILSIPYDKGFTIYVDDDKITYEKVDESFIGFKIEKGYHDIKINYTSPMLNIGKIVSLIGIILLIINIYLEVLHGKNKRNIFKI